MIDRSGRPIHAADPTTMIVYDRQPKYVTDGHISLPRSIVNVTLEEYASLMVDRGKGPKVQSDSYHGEVEDIAAILIRALQCFADHDAPNGAICLASLSFDAGSGISRCDRCGYYSDPFDGLEA